MLGAPISHRQDRRRWPQLRGLAKGLGLRFRDRSLAGQGCVAGHFGAFLQGRIGPQGPVALVTLPCPVLRARAICHPSRYLTLWQNPPAAVSRARLAALLDQMNLPRHGRFCLRCDMPQGGGAGALTTGPMALARAAGASDTALITDACLAIEGASDPLLVSHAERILWASRQGQVLTQMPALPRYDIIGGFLRTGAKNRPARP